jgi:hypothetical protein
MKPDLNCRYWDKIVEPTTDHRVEQCSSAPSLPKRLPGKNGRYDVCISQTLFAFVVLPCNDDDDDDDDSTTTIPKGFIYSTYRM